MTFVMINRVIRLMDVAEVKREGENWTGSIYLPATVKHVFPSYDIHPVFVFCKSYPYEYITKVSKRRIS